MLLLQPEPYADNTLVYGFTMLHHTASGPDSDVCQHKLKLPMKNSGVPLHSILVLCRKEHVAIGASHLPTRGH